MKLWQFGVLIAVLVAAVGGSYGVWVRLSSPGGSSAGANQQLIPVRYGKVVNQVSTSGGLVFANRATLTFGAPGTVGEVLVAEGQGVEEGEILVTLDAATVASLEKTMAQARVNLRNAQDALDKVKAPYAPDDVARAQVQIDSAQVSLANAAIDVYLAQKDWANRLQAAEDAAITATDAYRGVFSRWLGIELSESEVDLAPAELLGLWGADLTVLFNPRLRFSGMRDGFPSDDPGTRWSEPLVYVWLNLYPGTIAPTCEGGTVPAQDACVQKELNDAWDAYFRALDNLDTVQTQAAKAIASAGNALARAQDSLATAREALADLQAPPDPLDVALKETEIVSAQIALGTALQRLEGAILRAPMAGIVSAVNVEAGQTVNANTAIVEVVDPSAVELDGVVDEVDVLFVQLGAQANVSMDALPGQVLEGIVSGIASAARTQQGVVSYPIRIRIQVAQGVQLREGLSATANIIIREENNVLLVPLQALYGTFQQPLVKVMNSGRIEDRPVVLGSSDDYWVAVRQGLSEGEQVVMEAQAATTSQFGIFGGGGAGFREFRGTLGGGGTAPGGSVPTQPTPRPNR